MLFGVLSECKLSWSCVGSVALARHSLAVWQWTESSWPALHGGRAVMPDCPGSIAVYGAMVACIKAIHFLLLTSSSKENHHMQTIFIRKFYPNQIIQREFWNFVKSEELQTCNLKFCEIKLKDLRRVSFIQKSWGYLTKSLKVFSWSISDLVSWWKVFGATHLLPNMGKLGDQS